MLSSFLGSLRGHAIASLYTYIIGVGQNLYEYYDSNPETISPHIHMEIHIREDYMKWRESIKIATPPHFLYLLVQIEIIINLNIPTSPLFSLRVKHRTTLHTKI